MSYCHLKDIKENIRVFFLNFVILCHPTTQTVETSWSSLHFSLSTASIKWARFQNMSGLLCEARDRDGVGGVGIEEMYQ